MTEAKLFPETYIPAGVGEPWVDWVGYDQKLLSQYWQGDFQVCGRASYLEADVQAQRASCVPALWPFWKVIVERWWYYDPLRAVTIGPEYAWMWQAGRVWRTEAAVSAPSGLDKEAALKPPQNSQLYSSWELPDIFGGAPPVLPEQLPTMPGGLPEGIPWPQGPNGGAPAPGGELPGEVTVTTKKEDDQTAKYVAIGIATVGGLVLLYAFTR